MNNNAIRKFQNNIFLHFPSLESTNIYALNILSKSNPTEGTAISTYNQLKGRGQIGSKWESMPNKNISLSVILYPNFVEARQTFKLNQAISMATHDFIQSHVTGPVKIKWPNDIYINDLKVAGLLIQNAIQGHFLQNSVVGIGININQNEFSKDLPNPTSFFNETGKSFDLDVLTAELFERIEHFYFQYKFGGEKLIQEAYQKVLYRRDLKTTFSKKDGSTFVGTIRSTTNIGQLQIENENGENQFFNLKEVSYK